MGTPSEAVSWQPMVLLASRSPSLQVCDGTSTYFMLNYLVGCALKYGLRFNFRLFTQTDHIGNDQLVTCCLLGVLCLVAGRVVKFGVTHALERW
jgi:hypothetical protein